MSEQERADGGSVVFDRPHLVAIDVEGITVAGSVLPQQEFRAAFLPKPKEREHKDNGYLRTYGALLWDAVNWFLVRVRRT